MPDSSAAAPPPPGTAQVRDIIAKLKKRTRDDEGEGETRRLKKQRESTDMEVPAIGPEPPIEDAENDKKEKKGKEKEKKEKKEKKKEKKESTKKEKENTKKEENTKREEEKKAGRQPPDEAADALAKHKSIRQKLSKVRSRALNPPPPPADSAPADSPAITAAGLEPLPQPAPTKEPRHSVTLASALPPWLASPTVVAPTATVPFADIPGLSPRLLARLAALSLPHAFAVQSAVVPLLLAPGRGDVCISAATGSGKTLAYALPIIQSLSTRTVTRLRAVIVVPTRELVSQVFATASALVPGTGLKIGTAVGSRALAAEQSLLVGATDDGVCSSVDVLISTPGRLVEHIKNTPGFTLQWIKWLVVDEADRLLAQSFQEWVDVVIAAADFELPRGHMAPVLEDLGVRVKGVRNGVRKVVLSATMTRDAGKLAGLKLRRPTMVVVENPKAAVNRGEGTDGSGEKEEEEEKGEEEDDAPDEIFSVPAELREYAVPVADTGYKPLHLLYLLRDRNIKSGTVVFVRSNEGAARLARLIDTFVERAGLEKTAWTTGLISGEMEKKRRDKVLKAFRRGEIQIIVASDLISRGLDLPHVEHIVNYDIPSSARAYVHRVGRTARAGRGGEAFTLLADKEARWFWRSVGKGIRRREEGVERLAVGLEEEGMGWRGVYEDVLYG